MLYNLSLQLDEKIDKKETFSTDTAEKMKLGHYGTHLDRLLWTSIPLEHFKRRALLFDVAAFWQQKEIQCSDLELELIEAGDFIVFRTGVMAAYGYTGSEYMKIYGELSWELIKTLTDKKVSFIGLDARGIRRNDEHKEADMYTEKNGCYVIENLTGLCTLPEKIPFIIYTACFEISATGIPCKVVAEI